MLASEVVVRSTKYRTLTSCATIPAPNPVNSPVARSNTSTSWPRVRSSNAVVNPPIEPPTIATRSALASTLRGIEGIAFLSCFNNRYCLKYIMARSGTETKRFLIDAKA